MILVTVGTHDQPFDRLVQAADDLARLADEKVFIQTGVSKLTPTHAGFRDFVSMEEMNSLIEKARVVIAQAGAGTIITVLKYGKPLILVPRLKQFNEIINDHQLELAEALQAQNRVVLVAELSGVSLLAAVNDSSTHRPIHMDGVDLSAEISKVLQEWN